MIERILDRLFERQEIHDGCEADSVDETRPVYLKRYFLVMNDNSERSGTPRKAGPRSLTVHRAGNGFQVYLHCIKRSDADRELHDHPWSFIAVMLWRGYVEETGCIYGHEECAQRLRKWPGMVLVRRAEHRHRVHVTGKPAWSLVFTTGKRRMWGFWRDGSFIPWQRFISRKCAESKAVTDSQRRVTNGAT